MNTASSIAASVSPDLVNRVLGIEIWSAGLRELVDRSMSFVQANREQPVTPWVFACANPHSLVVAERDAEFKHALRKADAVVADGVGLTLVAQAVYGIQALPRITGSDYFNGLMQALDARGGRVAFFGSRPEVLRMLAQRCAQRFPRVVIADSISPPYGNWSDSLNDEFLARIREARVDALWVGMTAPKQEKWTQANRDRIQAGVVGSIGAVFDYFAGTVRRAPGWVCRAGLEWAYRFAHEPARLWERNLVSAPRFISLALRERMTPSRGSG